MSSRVCPVAIILGCLIGSCFTTAHAQPLAYVANRESNNVTIVDTIANQATATVAVGAGPHGVAVTPNGAFAYVVNQLSNNVSLIETTSQTVVNTIAVGTNPYGLAITHDGARVYVANRGSDTVSVIATTNNLVVATIPVGDGPKKIAITPDDAFAYVTNEHSNNVSVIALASNSVTTSIAVGIVPIGIALTPNGATAYVANATSNDVSVIDTASNTRIATIPVGINPQSIVVTPNGAFAYVTNYLSNSLSVISTSNNTVSATVTNVSSPVGIDVSANGALIYATSFQTNVITSVSTATNVVSSTIAVGTGPVAVDFAPAQAGNSLFVKMDSSTQGNWQGVYGADGYHLINGTMNYPAYAQANATGQAAWTWAAATTDIRALQKPAASDRLAATWYSTTSFNLTLEFTDGNAHQVALYFLDWDNVGRAQTVEVLNTQTGALLDTRAVAAFTGGKYLVWNLSGRVTLRMTRTAGHNAVLSGIFFGGGGAANQPPLVSLIAPNNGAVFTAPATINLNATASDTDGTVTRVDFYAGATLLGSDINSPYSLVWNNVAAGNYMLTATATDNAGALATSLTVNITVNNSGTFAVFVQTDTITQGNWKTVYGTDGYQIINDASSLPAYAQLSVTGQAAWTWAAATNDARALQRAATDRIAATWFNNTAFAIDLNLTDANPHQVALYFLDWDNVGRAQTVEVINAQTGVLLDTRTVADFTAGKYLVWNLSGHITLRLTRTAGHNAVVSGLFFAPN